MNGRLLFREMVLFARAHEISIFIFVLILPMIRYSLFFIVRYIEKGTFMGFGLDGYLYTAVELPNVIMFTMLNYFFIFVGLLDFHRRMFLIKAVGALIHPFKQNLDHKY